MAAVPTRCATIDEAIGGGFRLGQLSEVCGESGVGKTQICLQTVATAIANVDVGGLGGSAIYISCVTPFPRRRLEQMVAQLPKSSKGNTNVLERVTTWRGCTPYELKGFVDELGPKLKEENAKENYKVIIIDTIFGFVTHHFPDTKEGFDERCQLIRAVGFGLKRLAKQHNVAIIACNNTVDLGYGSHINAFRTSSRLVKPGVGLEWDRNLYVRYVMAKEVVAGQEGWGRTFQIFDRGQYYGRCRYTITEAGVCSASSAAGSSTIASV